MIYYYAGIRITQVMVHISMIYYARIRTNHGTHKNEIYAGLHSSWYTVHKYEILCRDQDYTVHGTPGSGLNRSWYTYALIYYAGIRITQFMVHTHDILCRDRNYTVHGIHKHDKLCRDQNETVLSIHKNMIYYTGIRIKQFNGTQA